MFLIFSLKHKNFIYRIMFILLWSEIYIWFQNHKVA